MNDMLLHHFTIKTIKNNTAKSRHHWLLGNGNNIPHSKACMHLQPVIFTLTFPPLEKKMRHTNKLQWRHQQENPQTVRLVRLLSLTGHY